MNERIKKLTDEALKLAPMERVELIEGILQSLDATDPRLDSLWAREAADRIAAYQRGEIEAHDFDEVIGKYRNQAKDI